MYQTIISKENIRTKVNANNWEEAIRSAGALLLEKESISVTYIDEMVQAIHDLGPYIVIAPHVALAHARPGESVLQDDISLITLASPVKFGSAHNDPVKLVFAFCAKESNSHLNQLTSLASILENKVLLDSIYNSGNAEEIYQLLANLH